MMRLWKADLADSLLPEDTIGDWLNRAEFDNSIYDRRNLWAPVLDNFG